MDYVLLSTEEASELAKVSSDEIVALVEAGELGGMRVAGQWRVPLKSVALLLASHGSPRTTDALEDLFNDGPLWERVFAAHPEVIRATAGERSLQGVRAYLRRAIQDARTAPREPAGDD